MKNSNLIFLAICMMLVLSATAVAETSKYEAGEIAEDYVYSGESHTVYGPYINGEYEYFVIEVTPTSDSSSLSAMIIVNSTSGDIVLDQEIFYTVAKIHLVFSDAVYYDSLSIYGDNVMIIRDEITYWDDSQDFWEETAELATKNTEEDAANEAALLCNEIVDKFQDELKTTQELIDALNALYEGNPTESEINQLIKLELQLNDNYKASQLTAIDGIEKFPLVYDEFTDTSSTQGIKKAEWEDYEEMDLQELGNSKDAYSVLIYRDENEMYSWVEDDTDWSWEAMNDRVAPESELVAELESLPESVPGFGIIVGVMSILVSAFVFQRRNDEN